MAFRVVFIGCVELSYAVLDRIIAVPDIAVAGVVTRRRSLINTDFRSLEPLAHRTGCPLLLVERNDQSSIVDFTRSLSPQLMICVGWSYLLGPELWRWRRGALSGTTRQHCRATAADIR